MVSGLPEGRSPGYMVGYSGVSSQATASKQNPMKAVGWVQGEVELCRWHNVKLIRFCRPRLSRGLMRKGVLILLGARPGISTLHSVQVPQELFFEDFDLSDRFRNNAWIVLLVASWGVFLHTEFCIDMTG